MLLADDVPCLSDALRLMNPSRKYKYTVELKCLKIFPTTFDWKWAFSTPMTQPFLQFGSLYDSVADLGQQYISLRGNTVCFDINDSTHLQPSSLERARQVFQSLALDSHQHLVQDRFVEAAHSFIDIRRLARVLYHQPKVDFPGGRDTHSVAETETFSALQCLTWTYLNLNQMQATHMHLLSIRSHENHTIYFHPKAIESWSKAGKALWERKREPPQDELWRPPPPKPSGPSSMETKIHQLKLERGQELAEEDE